MSQEHERHHNLLDSVSHRFLEHVYNGEFIGALSDPCGQAEMTGSCGDSIGMHIAVRDGAISAIAAQPRGCAFTVACADAVGFLAQGLTLDGALALAPEDVARELDGLPEDHMHCARLALNALGEAVAQHLETSARIEREKG